MLCLLGVCLRVAEYADEWLKEWADTGFCVACYLRHGGARVDLINPLCDGCLCDDAIARDDVADRVTAGDDGGHDEAEYE